VLNAIVVSVAISRYIIFVCSLRLLLTSFFKQLLVELKSTVETIQPGDYAALLAKSYLLESYLAKLCGHHVSHPYQPKENVQSPDFYFPHVLPLLDQLDLLAIECFGRKSSNPRTAVLFRCLQETRAAFTPQDQVKSPIFGPSSFPPNFSCFQNSIICIRYLPILIMF
jgi:hypothetical protein